ncbi:MAG: wax ester/triacylglycerol synthase family O-acyltransferase [Candidatus Phosphoribacter sp.]
MEATQLTAFDASFLALDTPVSAGHVCLLALLDQQVEPEQLHHQIASRLYLAPLLRRKLKLPTFLVGRPWWVDDPDFDLDNHLSYTDLGGTGTQVDMCADAVAFSVGHLDRAKPLWELHLVGGLADGSGALVTKFHHCAVDGIGKRDLLALLFGIDESLDPHHRWRPDGGPGPLSRVGHRVTEATERTAAALRLEVRAVTAVPSALLKASRGTAALIADGWERLVEQPGSPASEPGLPTPAALSSPPSTPFNASITARRAWAWTSLPVAASSPVRHRTGTSVNDILMACAAGALRAWLSENNALPNDPLVTMVPMSARHDAKSVGNNQIVLTLCALPTHLESAADRLAYTHAAMAQSKDSPTYPSSLMNDVAAVAGPMVTQLLTQAAAAMHLADRVQLPFNLMISNVPAPARRFQVGRSATVVGTFPFPPITDGLGLSITVQGYPGELCLGIGACPDLLPDPDRLRDLLVQAHDELVALG